MAVIWASVALGSVTRVMVVSDWWKSLKGGGTGAEAGGVVLGFVAAGVADCACGAPAVTALVDVTGLAVELQPRTMAIPRKPSANGAALYQRGAKPHERDAERDKG